LEHRDKDRRYKTLFENANDTILLIEKETILDCNPAAQKLLGRSKDNIVGKSLIDLSPKNQPDGANSKKKLDEKLEKALENEKTVFEWEMLDSYDENITVEISLNSVEIQGKKQIHAIIRDLTGIKRAIGPLHSSTRALMDAENIEDVLDEASSAANQLLGFTTSIIREADEEKELLKVRETSGEIEGLDIEERPDYNMEDSPQTDVYRNKETVIHNISEDDKHDRDPFSQAMYVPIGDFGVFSFGLVEGRVSEKDKKLAEILAKNTETAIKKVNLLEDLRRSERESEEKYSTLVEEARDPVFIVQDGKFVFVNQRVTEILDIPRDELEGNEFITHVHPEDRDMVAELHRKRMMGEEVESQYEMRILDSNGDTINMQFNTSTISYNGETAVMVISRDVSGFKDEQREIKRQNEKLENFASVLSHDLRNPLNVASGYTDMLMEENSFEELEEIKNAHSRMENIIDDILELTKNSKPVESFEKLDLESVASKAWKNVSTEGSKLNVESDTYIMGHESRVLRVFENIFRNAIEHNDKTEITVGKIENNNKSGFYIQNTGKPIQKDKLGKIFDYGYSGKEDGTGIGLSTVKNIVDAHGWDIEVENSSKGPIFKIISAKDI